MKSLRQIIEQMTHDYMKGYEHGFKGNAPEHKDNDNYMRGHKSGKLSRALKVSR